MIAVPGLNGHGFGSFKERKGNWMWLRDGLAKDLPNSRTLVFALDTHLIDSQSSQNITDLGGGLRAALGLVCKEPKRPLVLIGHSLGGIIVKEVRCNHPKRSVKRTKHYWEQAVNLMAASKAEADQAVLRSLAGIILFGVPSHGMAIGSLLPMVGDNPNRALLETLTSSSTVLRSQGQAFLKTSDGPNAAFQTISFYETQKSPTAVQDVRMCDLRRKVIINPLWQGPTQRWTMTGPTEILVDPNSATNGRVHDGIKSHNYPIDSTHSDLVKFSSEKDGSYKIVLEHLEKMQGFSGLKRGG